MKTSRDNNKAVGLTVIGGMLIVGALGQIRVIADYEWYRYCVDYLPPFWISVRYAVSWLQRALGLVVGFGLLGRRKWAANTAIFMSVFNIATVYLRYPYQAFFNQSLFWQQRWGDMFASWGMPTVVFSNYVQHAVIAAYIFDISFYSVLLFYLTRPVVRTDLR